jgi:nucleoside-diphosphate-sugar epimerase
LLLGATGFIGSATLSELLTAKHEVLALARSEAAEQALERKGARPVRGDLRNPQEWSNTIADVDAVIHLAVTWTEDMGDIDRQVIQALIEQASKANRRIRFLYTGGCWLYGRTGDLAATENSPFKPIRSFAWMVENSATVLAAPCFSANVLHPAMCYERDGGVFSRLMPRDGCIEVWGSVATRWPVVHKADLAAAYRLVLERAPAGESYNVSAEAGIRVGDVAAAIAGRFGVEKEPKVRTVPDLIVEHGEWAEGPTLDQQMSSRKIRDSLNWQPIHTDAVREMAGEKSLPRATATSPRTH